jgi:alkanesulfonate monooxygenase SsuD/methylene tetrahydromethanopterin reductase-like flavin-dependent oxidoreductase (luciferase family)
VIFFSVAGPLNIPPLPQGRPVQIQAGQSAAGMKLDVGALVYFLSAVTWQVPDLDVDRYDAKLRELDAAIREFGPVVFRDHHRYLVEARKR